MPVGPAVKWLGAYAFTVALTTTAVLLYTPLFAFERVQFSATAAGMMTALTGSAGVVARIFWGRFAERRESPADALSLLAAVAGLALLLVAASELSGPWLLWIGLFAFGSSGMAASAVVMLAVIREAPAGQTGRASGAVGLGMFLGFMCGPVSFGAIVDRTHSYAVGWLVLAGICLVALIIVRMWVRSTANVAR